MNGSCECTNGRFILNGILDPQCLSEAFHLFPSHGQDIFFISHHLNGQTVVGPWKHFRDVAEIDKIALVDAVKSAGGQPFLIFPQELVLCVISVRGVYDTAASGGLNVYDTAWAVFSSRRTDKKKNKERVFYQCQDIQNLPTSNTRKSVMTLLKVRFLQ